MTWTDAVAYIGIAVSLFSYAMDGIIELRIIGLASALIFLVQGIATHSTTTIVEQVLVLPINLHALLKMLRLVRQSKEALAHHQTMEWLKPFSTSVPIAAGHVLFKKDDLAQHVYYIDKGTFRLLESGITLKHGAVVGELGFLSPGNRRTQTLQCEQSGTLLRISYDRLKELYFQNPKFGLFLLQLIAERLFENHHAALKERETAVQ